MGAEGAPGSPGGGGGGGGGDSRRRDALPSRASSSRLGRLRKAVTVGSPRPPSLRSSTASVALTSATGAGAGGGGGAGALSTHHSASAVLRPHRSARAALGVPAMPLTPLGDSWAADILAVPHNSMRAEARDAATMLCRLVGQPDDIVDGDWASFWGWMDVWRAWAVRLLDAEEEVLLPWAEGDSPLPLGSGVSAEERAVAVAGLRRVLVKLGAHRDAFDAMPPARRAARLKAILDRWAVDLQRYYAMVEAAVPPLLLARAAGNPAAATAAAATAARALADYMADGPDPRVHTVLLCRSLDGHRRAGVAWRAAALDRKAALAFGLWRSRVAASHYETISYFLRMTTVTPVGEVGGGRRA
ncbi:hypothetical protein I4F81_007142 [Pyropia yezoensis]|uniref:Uncharacterized protein n=1 Tax=Pyropia yezoensis TaxID=2788 RepID=A0ACC3C450_PYRYE|nr:hypothetical protein I4F81_007142 [Neopyropia yezoensis]